MSNEQYNSRQIELKKPHNKGLSALFSG